MSTYSADQRAAFAIIGGGVRALAMLLDAVARDTALEPVAMELHAAARTLSYTAGPEFLREFRRGQRAIAEDTKRTLLDDAAHDRRGGGQ